MIEKEYDRFYSAGFSVYARMNDTLDGSWSGYGSLFKYVYRIVSLGGLTPLFVYQISTMLYNEY